MKVREVQNMEGDTFSDVELLRIIEGCDIAAAIDFIKEAGARGAFVAEESLLGISRSGKKTAAKLRADFTAIIAHSTVEFVRQSSAVVGGRTKATVHGLTNGIASAWGHEQD